MFGGKSAAPKKRKAVWEESAETDRNLELSHGSGGGLKVLSNPTTYVALFRSLVVLVSSLAGCRNPLADGKCFRHLEKLTGAQVVVAVSLNMPSVSSAKQEGRLQSRNSSRFQSP